MRVRIQNWMFREHVPFRIFPCFDVIDENSRPQLFAWHVSDVVRFRVPAASLSWGLHELQTRIRKVQFYQDYI